MNKDDCVCFLLDTLKRKELSNEERDAIRSAISTLTWLIARRAKQRANKRIRESEVK